MTQNSDIAAGLELLDYTLCDLKLDGSLLTREGVASIIDGGLIPGISMQEHEEAGCHKRALLIMKEMIRTKTDLSRVGLLRIASAWDGMNSIGPRTIETFLPHLSHSTPAPEEIETLLDGVFMTAPPGKGLDPAAIFLRAAALHNGIIAVYPFDSHNEMLARAALQYELLKAKYPIFTTEMTESEYNELVAEAIATGNHKPFATVIESSVGAKRVTHL